MVWISYENALFHKILLAYYQPFSIRVPTGESVGSDYVTQFEPTDSPVGALKNKGLTYDIPLLEIIPNFRP